MNLQEINLSEIVILERLRTLNKEMIKPLSDSIQKNGLLHPITINQNKVLLSGYHRYTAYKELNLETILCNIVDVENEDIMRLIEIDENLMRTEIHYLDLSDSLKLRKEIYERLYPETVLGASGKGRKKDKKSFVDDVTEKINKSKSSIYNLLNISNSLNNDEKIIIKELNISQTDSKILIDMEPNDRKEVLDNMKNYNYNLKKSMKYLRNDRNSKKLEKITRPLNSKFINHIQIGNTIEIIKNIPNDVKYDCFFVDINFFSDNFKKQLDEIDNFLNNVDNLLYDDSVLFFFSNEKIDNKLESKLINKFKRVERIFIVNRENTDSLFEKVHSTVYVCRNFKNTNNIPIGLDMFDSKKYLIESISRNPNFKNISIFEPYIDSYNIYESCKLYNLNYFGICSSIDKYVQMDKIIDLTKYFNEYLPNDFKLSDNIEIVIIKNSIFVINDEENKRFFINVDDKLNDNFTVNISLNNRNINEILNFISGVENFKILFYQDHINIIIDGKKHCIYYIHTKDDPRNIYLSIKKYFNINVSNKEKIQFELDDTINDDKFDMYLLYTNENYNYYIGNSKLIKNLQVGIRIPLQEITNINYQKVIL